MPNRIIKESICTSDKLSTLSDFEFRVWIALLVSADDAGNGDARPSIIKGHCFPLRERVTVKDIENALHSLAAHSCVSLYKVGGKPYYSFPTWAAHQRIDRAKPKFPAPKNADPQPFAADCGNSPQVAADRGNSRAESNPIQSESNPNPEAHAREAAAAVECTRIEAYAASNLDFLSPRNMDELVEFVADLSDELVRHAIDEACASGKRTWAYVRSILRRYLTAGYKTLGEVKAAEAKRDQQKQPEQKPEPKPKDIRWF